MDPGPTSFPRVDDPLVRPETREEMVRGRKIHPIRAMLDQAEADQTVVWGLRTKGNPAIQTIETRAKEEGRAEGRAEGARTAIEALCDVLGIPLGPERHGHIRRLDARALNGLLDHLRHERRWPGTE